MPSYKDTIMIRAGSVERAVEVVIDAPARVSVVNLQELAEKGLARNLIAYSQIRGKVIKGCLICDPWRS